MSWDGHYRTDDQVKHLKVWVEALRSGEYDQLSGFLGSSVTNERCCLGVACDITENHKLIPNENDNFLLDPIMERNDLPETAFMVDYYGLAEWEFSTLSRMNDEGDNFDSIADYIEDHYIPVE